LWHVCSHRHGLIHTSSRPDVHPSLVHLCTPSARSRYKRQESTPVTRNAQNSHTKSGRDEDFCESRGPGQRRWRGCPTTFNRPVSTINAKSTPSRPQLHARIHRPPARSDFITWSGGICRATTALEGYTRTCSAFNRGGSVWRGTSTTQTDRQHAWSPEYGRRDRARSAVGAVRGRGRTAWFAKTWHERGLVVHGSVLD